MSNSTVEYMKSNIADLIYSEATIEGVGSTFEQTQKIIEEGNALGLQEWQLRALLNLKQAWQYLLIAAEYHARFFESVVGECGRCQCCLVTSSL